MTRPFGVDPGDLELDLRSPDRPAVVTRVITRCQAHTSEAEFVTEPECWALPVGTRIERLLAIVARTSEDALDVAVQCREPGCGTTLELTLSAGRLTEFAREAGAAPSVVVDLPDGRTARFRRPLGQDQRRWREASFPTQAHAMLSAVRSLAVEGADQLPDEPGPWIDVVGEAMEAADPLVVFRCEARCPACGVTRSHPVDLEALTLARLGALQRETLAEVHLFARRYGWSEADTLTVPRARRLRYRALLRAEETA